MERYEKALVKSFKHDAHLLCHFLKHLRIRLHLLHLLAQVEHPAGKAGNDAHDECDYPYNPNHLLMVTPTKKLVT